MTKKKAKDEFGLKEDRLEKLKQAKKPAADASTVTGVGGVYAPKKKVEPPIEEEVLNQFDLITERDMLAQQVIELTHERDELKRLVDLDLLPTNDLLSAMVMEQPNAVVELRAFLSDCLKTGTFNSTRATELLK